MFQKSPKVVSSWPFIMKSPQRVQFFFELTENVGETLDVDDASFLQAGF